VAFMLGWRAAVPHSQQTLGRIAGTRRRVAPGVTVHDVRQQGSSRREQRELDDLTTLE
jgi:hypothetical protein